MSASRQAIDNPFASELAVTDSLAKLRTTIAASRDPLVILRAFEDAILAHLPRDAIALWLTQPLASASNLRIIAMPLPPESENVRQLIATPDPTRTSKLGPTHPFPAEFVFLAPLVSTGVCHGIVLIDHEPSAEIIAQLGIITALAAAAITASLERSRAETATNLLNIRAQELGIAELIQRSLLPQELPRIPGWTLSTCYQPARIVGGDLYDFIALPNGLLGIVLGDASDKGVPAALMMATVKPLLRAAAQRLVLPSLVLAQVNDDLCPQVPPGMFVTCFFALLDPTSGRLRFANAGQTAPFVTGGREPESLDASGWPLGMLPGRTYDESEIILTPGRSLVLYSDGLSETTNAQGQLFGTDRIGNVLTDNSGIDPILALESARLTFEGAGREQDDDMTLVALSRQATPSEPDLETTLPMLLSVFNLPSTEGIGPIAADAVAVAARDLALTPKRRNRLYTAVAEAAMNAAEHGNELRADRMVDFTVASTPKQITVTVSDQGAAGPIAWPPEPNLDAKLAGLETVRGWGLFLISRMVDQCEVRATPTGNSVELTMLLGADLPDKEISAE